MNRRYILAAAFVGILGRAEAAERLPTFPKRTNYDEARSSLQSLGWAPVTQRGKRCDADGCYARCAPGFEERCERYPEAENCRGTGLAACDMLWRRGDRLIEVRTTGEDDPPTAAGVRCRAGC